MTQMPAMSFTLLWFCVCSKVKSIAFHKGLMISLHPPGYGWQPIVGSRNCIWNKCCCGAPQPSPDHLRLQVRNQGKQGVYLDKFHHHWALQIAIIPERAGLWKFPPVEVGMRNDQQIWWVFKFYEYITVRDTWSHSILKILVLLQAYLSHHLCPFLQ